MRLSRRIMAIIAGLALLPLFATLLTALLAGVLGCEVNEGGPTPCYFLGMDIGGVMSTLFTAGWFSLLTIPLLMGLIGLWALVEAYVWGRQRRRLKREARQRGI